jgi:lysozyme family protein
VQESKESKMADFNVAIEKVFKDEGGYVNDENDRGGKTKFGISQASFPEIDIETLTRDQAKDIYFTNYWGNISGINDQGIAEVVLEIAVMSGNKKAITLLQKAANRCGAKLIEDGTLGEQTLKAANVLHPKWLLAELKLLEIENFARIVMNNKMQQKFLLGWVNRGLS